MRYLITGCCGFIGHHLVEHILKADASSTIVGIDKLSYASGGLDRLRDFGATENGKFRMITWDLLNAFSDGLKYEIERDGPVDIIIHMAAETHVDNSIEDPIHAINNNVMSTVNLLEYARASPSLKLFFYFSTDEVFGPAPGTMLYKEWDRHNPTNPYSASKSASENICLAYENTYKVPIMIVNVMNVFGERQHVEKFLPKVIKNIRDGVEIQIHADAECKNPGSRFYIHARNVASAVMFLVKNGKIGDKYNISGEKEVSNLELVEMVSAIMNKPALYKLVNFHGTRPGHDLRYGLDGTKLLAMGWTPPVKFDEALERVVKWTLKNSQWLDW